ncbi:hypothetical protein GCM10011504_14460 [Siccirubricoccus deserti]|uniref:Uncharacterized protein n=2 Tax=Siccirubricoccus deserti TaxID=2013562 RepID=A0A9X0QX61_9PROT|nr:hypothetical protein [Siccirubricoccus deserti]GGC37201.1 hypothetical protein GCM10011504_14460 [Siccirubricoccus deserti]
MRRWVLLMALGLPLAATLDADAQGPAPQRQGPPHEWTFGAWTGGQFPAGDTDTPACFGSPTVIFTRDVVMRATPLDTAYRQRNIETVAVQPNGLEFRFTPAAPVMGAMGPRAANDAGFGCSGNPNLLRVERRGPDEIVFPDCSEFPSPLKRCVTK